MRCTASRASAKWYRLQPAFVQQAPHCKLALARCDSVSMLSLSDTPLNDSYRPVGTMHVVFGSVQKRQLAARKTLVFFETGKNSRLRGPRAAPGDA